MSSPVVDAGSFAIVTTTLGDGDAARAMARALVGARLAACVQIVPIESVYRWEGVIETAPEHMLICKIIAADFEAVEAAIRARHAYDVPEIVMTPIEVGHAPYLEWIARCCAPDVDDTQKNGAQKDAAGSDRS